MAPQVWHSDITESGDWLTDTIIDAAQNVLAAQFKAQFSEAGFQCVGLGSTFAFEVKSDKFVQILHNDHNHWLTISSVGTTPGQTLVYDSMYPSAGQATKQQIACLMRVSELNLTLTFTDVQMQAGGSDCGAFALAFATAICYGHSPGELLRSATYASSFDWMLRDDAVHDVADTKACRQERSNLVRLFRFTAFAVCQK